MPLPTRRPVVTFLGDEPEISELKKDTTLGLTLGRLGVEQCFIFPNPLDNGMQTGNESKIRVSVLCRPGKDGDKVAEAVGYYFQDRHHLQVESDAIGHEPAGLANARSQGIITESEFQSASADVDAHFSRSPEPAGVHL